MSKQETVNAIRVLSAEAIQKAKSGHPGTPLGAAPIAYTLFADFLKFNPKNPLWNDRDRFILSAGHGSMLYYSLLYLFGYDITKQDIMNFRQFDSKTPGHPEYMHTAGVETTTGPLGQGIANAVGMAIAESHLSAKFNKPNFPIVDHYTYVLCGDGCLEEGIAYEACSLAGTQKLGKLILFYDCNNITIEGDIKTNFTDDITMRYKSQGWQVLKVEDANDLVAISKAIKKAKAEVRCPSIIICKSVIGYGSPLAGSEKSHGAPLGEENLQKLKETLNWNEEPFEIPEEVKIHCLSVARRGSVKEKKWKKLFDEYKKQYPELAMEYDKYMSRSKPDFEKIEGLFDFKEAEATRKSSSKILNRLEKSLPYLMGGSADLGSSNMSIMTNREYFSPENRLGTNFQFGIREHAMAAICNGMYLHGGIQSYSATFFIFTDYMKPAMRLSALMNIPTIYILTHDSIGVGEDGPTHQPVEQLISLRSIPNMKVFRPADGRETAAAWISALSGTSPTALVLSRQNLPQQDGTGLNALKGGYTLIESGKQTPDVILIGTGSELDICVKARDELLSKGVDARVVSMPCVEEFEKQSEVYKQSVLPSCVSARVCVEAGSPYSWYKYAGEKGEIISMSTFGKSAPASKLFETFGFTTENVVEKALKSMSK